MSGRGWRVLGRGGVLSSEADLRWADELIVEEQR